jgi:hypothetical protein
MTDTAPPKPRGRPRKHPASVEGSDKPKATRVEGQRGAAPPHDTQNATPRDNAAKLTGRPTIFEQDTADAICNRLSGGDVLCDICADPDMPAEMTVRNWLRDKPRFLLAYNRARVEQTRTWADQIIKISRGNGNDTKEMTKPSGKVSQVVDRAQIERDRLRIYAMQWVIGKHNKAEYGEGSTDPQTGTPALLDANPSELVVQLVHLLGQFDIKLTPEQVEQVKHAVSRGEDDPAILGR